MNVAVKLSFFLNSINYSNLPFSQLFLFLKLISVLISVINSLFVVYQRVRKRPTVNVAHWFLSDSVEKVVTDGTPKYVLIRLKFES